MIYLYHFTSKKNWEKIKKSGKIIPRTKIQWAYNPEDFTEKTRLLCTAKHYTVGFPEPFHKGWVGYGLWGEIFRLIKTEILLKIKIPKNSNGFVREHALCSPKGMKDKYGIDLYFLAYNKKISVHDQRIKESLAAYWNSAVSIKNYKNNFIVPEIWIPEVIKSKDFEEINFQKGFTQFS